MHHKMQNSIPCHGQETLEENITSVREPKILILCKNWIQREKVWSVDKIKLSSNTDKVL